MSVHYEDERLTLLHGDAIEQVRTLEAVSIQAVVTSPPYFGLRDYGEDGQYGAEATVGEFVHRLVHLFREIRRALADDGTVWLNLGDSYASNTKGSGGTGNSGLMRDGRSENGRASADNANGRARQPTRRYTLDVPEKNLLGVPWRVALALQADGWVLRSEIIWAKPNPMPESVTDRPTKSHEHIFLLAKSPSYYYDHEAIAEPFADDRMGASGARLSKYADSSSLRADGGITQAPTREKRNKRTVWSVTTSPFPGAHFATFPLDLVRPCILAGSRPGDTVLDPFSGSGTTGMVALQEGRKYVGIDLNADYLDLSLRERFQEQPLDIYGATA